MIRNILLDLDDTILDFAAAERAAIARALTDFGVEANDATLKMYAEINLSFWKRLERGEIDRHEVLVGRFRTLFDRLGISGDIEAVNASYGRYLSFEHPFMNGGRELLEELYKDYRLYIISNGNANVQHRRIADSDIAKYFRDIFISEEIGCDKPDRDFFERSFARIPDFKREESIVVGDSLTSDIRGGKNAGVRTVWFNPKGKENRSDAVPDFEIRELRELKGILSSL